MQIKKEKNQIEGSDTMAETYEKKDAKRPQFSEEIRDEKDQINGLKVLNKSISIWYEVGVEIDDNGAPIDWLGDFDHAVEKIDNEYMRCILESKSKSSDTVRSITDGQDELLIVVMDEGIYIPDDGGAGHFVEYADITGVVENKDAIVIEAKAAFGLLDNKMMLTDEHNEFVISNPFRNKMIFKALRRTIADIVGLDKPDDGDISSVFEKNRNMADKCWIDDLYDRENVDSKRTISELVFDCHIYVSRNPKIDALCFACSDDESEWIVFFKDYFICKGNDVVTIANYDMIDHVEAAEKTLILSYPISRFDYGILLGELVMAKYKGQVMDKKVSDLAFKKEFISFKNDCFRTSVIADCIEEITRIV